ncbi:MAG TPA: redoxin domain-containing protein, partial [Burkholderiaceae bacterium]|nr:redoxin domain-containing protein [Burkholderiaceae bacterium]
PHIVAFAKTRQAPVIGLNYKDKRDDARAWLKQLGDPYELSLSDLDGRVGINFGVYGVPETFVIDKQGVIRFKHVGPMTPEVLQTRVVPLLKELNG